MLQQHVANDQIRPLSSPEAPAEAPPRLQHKEASAKEREIKRNLCDLLRRRNSVGETEIFTKILRYTRSDLSLPCVDSLRSKRFRLVLEERKTKERDFRFWPILARSLTLVRKPHENACYAGNVSPQALPIQVQHLSQDLSSRL